LLFVVVLFVNLHRGFEKENLSKHHRTMIGFDQMKMKGFVRKLFLHHLGALWILISYNEENENCAGFCQLH
jgi:hypothetical protein